MKKMWKRARKWLKRQWKHIRHLFDDEATSSGGDSTPGDKADAVPFSKLDFCWGGMKPKSASLTRARIKSLSVGKSGLRFAWASGGCEDLGAKSATDCDAAVACLFCRIGGKWRGGKFEWISTSRTTREFKNIRQSYSGWDPQSIEKADAYAFVILSADGKKRTNVASCVKRSRRRTPQEHNKAHRSWLRGLFGHSDSSPGAALPGTAVVVVGLERSYVFGKCDGARIDSDRMARLLADYSTDKPTVLQDASAHVNAVKKALSEAMRHELCILYYSGHGGRMRDSSGVGGWSEYLCLNNAPLHDYDIWKMVRKAAGRVVMVFDCCHSATMFRGERSLLEPGMEGAPEDFRNVGFSFDMAKAMVSALGEGTEPDLLVWSGCPEESYSYGSSQGGVMTNGLLKGFRPTQTYDQVWDRMSAAAASQRPVRTVIGSGFDGKVFR